MAWTKTDIQDAKETLLNILEPGDTIYTVLRNVSRSGMTRSIDVYSMKCDGGAFSKRWLSRLVAKAIDTTFDERREAVKVGGCGMDMGYHIVNCLGYELYPDGFECTGCDERGHDRCPSNDHSNGDRSYKPHHHNSGGYAFHHEWI